MSSKPGVRKLAMLALVAITIFALPLAAGAADVANGITSPAAGATVSGAVDVKGYASDPTFTKWQLDVLPGGAEDAAAFLALGETAGEFSYSFDTTAYPNGEHALRLRVVKADSNYTEYITKFTIANGAAKPAAAVTTATKPAAVMVAKNDSLGSFLADDQGRTLYLYTKDTPNTSNCYDKCEAAWPPLFTKGAAQAGAGVNASLLGTTTRTNGSIQVTYNSWPLYYFAKDQKPGDVTGQNVGGVWFVISPQGEKIETPTTAAAETKPAAAPAPTTNGITSPKAGAKVSGMVDVVGNASDPNFAKWQLDVLAGGSADAAIFAALGETSGVFTSTLDTTAFPDGDHALRLRVVRNDSNYDEYVTKFTIANAAAKPAAAAATATPAAAAPAVVEAPAAAAAPAVPNGITSPKDGATVSSAVEVKGNASDPNFAKWQLDVLPGGDANAPIFLGVGETPGAFTFVADTTAFPNGEHALRLRVVRTDGNYDEYITKFTISNAAGKAQALASGKYLRQGSPDRALQFKNGALTALLLPGDVQLAGATYTVKDNVYTETSNDQGCISNRHYTYTFDGTKLVFTPVEVYDPAIDSCDGRAGDFNPSVTWVMIK